MNSPTAERFVRRRNRAATIERILQATATLLAQKGVDETGINAVADQAQVNKVLIYRYFGGYNGLLETFVRRGWFLSFINDQTQETAPTPTTPHQSAQQWQAVLTSIAQELRDRPASRALIRWELANGQTELAQRVARLRNEAFRRLLSGLVSTTECEQSASAIVALVWGGLAYIALSSEDQPVLLDLPIQEAAGWQRIGQAIRCLTHHLAAESSTSPVGELLGYP